MECPFCHPDAARVFHDTDDLVFALWDGFPVSPGHALIVPRRHVAHWFDATLEEQHRLIECVALARQFIAERFEPDGYNIGINVGAASGQTVPHLHVHVIPRYAGDVADPRGGVRHVIPGKGNYLAGGFESMGIAEAAPGWNRLHGTEKAPLLRALVRDLGVATEVDLAVAFVLRSGLDLLEPHLYEVVERGGSVRVVTGDYLDVTEPEALMKLLDLLRYAERRAEPSNRRGGTVVCRVFQTNKKLGFHPKAYLMREAGGERIAYVGSSNITRSALERGVEWNHRLSGSAGDPILRELRTEFESLLAHPLTTELDAAWIDTYRARRRTLASRPEIAPVPQDDEPPPPPEPHSIQTEALEALRETRRDGHAAGLVVLATGLGKTWLSAFDSRDFGRVLFVAHREEILRQALNTFRIIRPDAHLGFYTGQEKDADADILFASVQTLGRASHLGQFPVDAFDYIVVDEFHHAAAATYRRLIDHFEPRFLLGLTATPDRSDGADLLMLCGENLVYRCDVIDGVNRELLSPFRYLGVPDSVDFRNIPWRSGRFDPEQLEHAVVTESRAANALGQWRKHAGTRGLGFCVSQRHADYMASHFRAEGIRALAVHAGPGSAPRSRTLERLEAGDIDIVFAVDMFNEGVDVPHVDTILMLRPTESRILWQQQFGRGLRRADGKSHVRVIDYIGNHRTFLQAAMVLLPGAADGPGALYMALERLQEDSLELPPGCEITYELEAMNILKALAKPAMGANATIAWYRTSRDQHDIRPNAVEAWHAGYDPRTLRKGFGSWFGFVYSERDLSDIESTAFIGHQVFFEALEVTPMVKSYKMLVLLAMISLDAFPGSVEISRLAAAVRHFAARNPLLAAEFGDDLLDDKALIRLLEKHPIPNWVRGDGMGGISYFEYGNNVFATRLEEDPKHHGALATMTRELCEYRLGQYLERLQHQRRIAPRFVCNVSHSNGKAVLSLPDRRTTPGIPEGEHEIRANDREYVARFTPSAVDVIHAPGYTHNMLSDILRDWFGEQAGQLGRSDRVRLDWQDEVYVMRPLRTDQPASGPERWKTYLRPDIPPLWGQEFNPGRWNQGYVTLGDHVFLMVSLDKTGLTDAHQYEEAFLSPDVFQWSSPNSATRSGAVGRKLANHQSEGVSVHLFVRTARKTPNGKGAPFVYCGEVDFVDWEGDKPIVIRWRLREAVPDWLHGSFGIA